MSLLSPPLVLSDVFPARSLLAMRAWDDANPFLPRGRVVRDGLTGGQLPVLGGQRACVHAALLGPAARRLCAMADILFPSDIVPFGDADDLAGLVGAEIAGGATVVLQYPPEPAVAAALSGRAGGRPPFLAAPSLLARLNDKAALDDLVPEGALLPRSYIPLGDLDPDRPPPLPAVVKAATRHGTGAGLDVRVCADAATWRAAVAAFRSLGAFLHGVVAERFEPFLRSWCANFAALPDGGRWLALGAAEQVVVDGHLYAGNVNGRGHEPPAGADALVEAIAGRAMAAGFRGIGGFDFAVADDGRLICFDANLRINGCTTQLLLHDAACARIGASVSRTVRLMVRIGPEAMIAVLRPHVEGGSFVPISFLDAALHPLRPAESILTGLLVGGERAELDALAERLRLALSPVGRGAT
jgi:hypothetical protein